MSINELEAKVRELKELQTLIEEARHVLQAGRHGSEKGPAGGGGALHPYQHHPPLCAGIRKAPLPGPTGKGAERRWSA